MLSRLREWAERRKAAASGDAPVVVDEVAVEAAAEWKARGNAALQDWNLQEAERCYRQAALQDAADPAARLNLAFVLIEQGRAGDATTFLTQALALRRPQDDIAHDIHFMLGRAHVQQGDTDAALAAFAAAVAARPDFAEAMEEAAKTMHDAGRFEGMLTWAKRIQAIRPSAGTDVIEAQALHGLKRNAEALALLDAAVKRDPANAGAWTGRGDVLVELRQYEEALRSFEQALALTGPVPESLVSCALALSRLGRHEEALRLADAALDKSPTDRDVLLARGNVLMAMVRIPEALACANEALAIYPDDADAHWNRAVCSLLLGDYAAGWSHYESRFHSAAFGRKGLPPDFGRPQWTGREDLAGRSILLSSEQGLGDAIQFLRFVPLVAARAGTVLLRVSPALAQLASGLAPNCRVVRDGEAVAAPDYVCPLMSLPLAFRTTLETLPATVPYLSVDAARVDHWRARLDDASGQLKVGIAWSGNASYNNDHNRSIPLATFRGLEAGGCQFISLQPDVRPTDAQALEQWTGLRRFDGEIGSFAETAALICALDLVVTVDTVFGHLAGALGRPVWILSAHSPDWRWMLEREDSPWYPTARLYRQAADGDWPAVLARVRADLVATAPASA
ncbi:MAG: tetratricopeptide repeat protein [Pseudomonadota bacterium]